MPEPVTIIACFKRRGGLRFDPGEGGSMTIEFAERERANALKAAEWSETFSITFMADPTPKYETDEKERP